MKESAKKAVLKLVEEAEKGNFYGEITLQFRDGTCYRVLKSQSIMLDDVEAEQKK